MTASTLAQLLRCRAERQPDRVGYTFLSDGEVTGSQLTYAALDRRARAVAARLSSVGATVGDRALLLFPPGIDFIEAFFGCMYAGVAAVPAFPPDPARLDRTLPRLLSVVADATPVAALTHTLLIPHVELLGGQAPPFGAMRWIATDTEPDLTADGWTPPDVDGAATAMLQYTSGSTGEPKGVVLSHRNLLHNSRLIHEVFGTTADSRALSWLPPYHDMGLIGGLLQPLYAGLPIWLMSPLDFLRHPLTWLEAVSRLRVTMSGGPNFAYDLCVRKTTPQQREHLDLSSWRVAFNGAEPVRRSTLERFAEAFAPAGFRAEAFLPCYGLAEATLIVSGGTARSRAGEVNRDALGRGDVVPAPPSSAAAGDSPLVSCGPAAAGQQIMIVDPATRRRCPAGRVGEIWVRGPSVAGGYWGRPAESRDVFRARIVDGGTEEYLRTGDLGFVRDGELVVTGRLKDLIIIRGRNHYPQDLEATAEQAHPVLRPGCAAALLVEKGGRERLALVHEVVRGAESVDVAAVARDIRRHLIEQHGVRVDLVVLLPAGTLPKTSSGKVRRGDCQRRLLAGELTEIGRYDTASAPLTPSNLLAAAAGGRRESVEVYLRGRVAALCGVPAGEIEPDLPLLAAGLDSLAAQQLGQQVEQELGVTLPLADILGGATLTRIAALITEPAGRDDGSAAPAVRPRAALTADAGLTPGQRALWVLQQLARQSTAYTTAAAFRLTGRLDAGALERALDDLVSRHPALRTTFPTRDGEPFQVIQAQGRGSLVRCDAGGLDDEALSARLTADARQPFDLAHGPLLRLHLYRRTDDDHAVLVTAHHIVSDFWSARILGNELAALYTEHTGGPPADLAPPRMSIADVIAWQDALLSSPAGEELERYWDRQLDGGIPPLNLAPPGAGPESSRSDARPFRFGRASTQVLRQCAAAEGVTVYVLLLTGYQALLHRLTGRDDIVIGTPVAARTRPGFAEIVGYLMNPVPLRSRATGGVTFRQLLRQTRAQVIGALQHQDLPSAEFAARHVRPPRHRLFRTMFIVNQLAAGDAARFPAVLLGHAGISRPFGGLQAESLPVDPGECAFDVELSLSEIDDTIHGVLRFRTDVLDQAAAQRFTEQFMAMVESGAADPGTRLGSLAPATGADRTRILHTWNATARALDTSVCVPQLFERQARRTPDARAVVFGSEHLSYRELDERADRLARLLREAGISRHCRVGICLDRGPALIVAVLAVLKAGAAYVPVDPVNPPERIAAMFADAAVAAVLSEDRLAGKVPHRGVPVLRVDADGPGAARPAGTGVLPPARPGDAAYVIYTSGSAGVPKGVEVPHRALTNYTLDAADRYRIGPGDRVLQFASIGFDASAEEIYPALISGACLVLRDDRMLASPDAFLAACAAQAVTVLDLPTAYWHDLVAALERGTATLPDTLRLVIIGGESAAPRWVAAWQDRVGTRVRLVNTYGPTEATIVATSFDVTGTDAAAGTPIGWPVANTRAYVLDDGCQAVPVGVVGELYLGGAGLARGYLNRAGLTAARFVADPFGPAGSRLYRTGDLARYRADGALVFVARGDRQIKLSGYRVEPGEVEAALRRLPGVADAAVVRHSRPGQLLAYVTPSDTVLPTGDELRTSLRAVLPGYMVPVQYVTLPALPRTTTGKIDYAELSALEPPSPPNQPDAARDLPRTPEERALAAIWHELLDVAVIGRHDDFFVLGGHSLLATRVLARVNERLGVDLPLRTLFESPTIAALATHLRQAAPVRFAPVTRAPRDQPLPLSFVQERIWFLQQLQPGSTNYNVPRALRLRGDVRLETVTRAFADLEIRHEILRTTFPDIDGEPVQRIHEPRGIPVALVDRCGLPESERDSWIREQILVAGQEPFDLAEGPLLRVTLVRLAAEEYVLILVEHHLIHDGWAQGVFLRDFLELYESHATGRDPCLPNLPVQYADFAVWQRRTIAGDRLEELLAFWRRRLEGAPALLRLPTDRPRPRVLTSRGGQETLTVDGLLAAQLRGFGRPHDVSLFMTMFAAFVTLLYGYSHQPDIVVGAGIANRQRPEFENLLGMMINTVPLRTDLSGDPPFVELLGRVRDTCLDSYTHQDMPLEKLVEHLRPTRNPSYMPLFQVMFNFLDTPMPVLRLPGITVEVLDAHNRSAKFDLNVVVIPDAEQRLGGIDAGPGPTGGEKIIVLLEYNSDLFDPATVRRLLCHYEALLRAVIAEPRRSIEDLVGDLGVDGRAAGVDPAAQPALDHR